MKLVGLDDVNKVYMKRFGHYLNGTLHTPLDKTSAEKDAANPDKDAAQHDKDASQQEKDANKTLQSEDDVEMAETGKGAGDVEMKNDPEDVDGRKGPEPETEEIDDSRFMMLEKGKLN